MWIQTENTIQSFNRKVSRNDRIVDYSFWSIYEWGWTINQNYKTQVKISSQIPQKVENLQLNLKTESFARKNRMTENSDEDCNSF